MVPQTSSCRVSSSYDLCVVCQPALHRLQTQGHKRPLGTVILSLAWYLVSNVVTRLRRLALRHTWRAWIDKRKSHGRHLVQWMQDSYEDGTCIPPPRCRGRPGRSWRTYAFSNAPLQLWIHAANVGSYTLTNFAFCFASIRLQGPYALWHGAHTNAHTCHGSNGFLQ